jgi:UDP-glucose 4-epimerase
MTHVLVTGGAGFIGSHVVGELLQRGYEVTVLDDLSGGFRDNVPAGAELVVGSITDAGLVDRLFRTHQFEYVCHFAAYAAEGLSHFIKQFNYTNNLIGSVNLINASINAGVKCFAFTSSIAVYGTSPVLPMTEDTPPHPEDPYGVAKLAVEQELAINKRFFDMNYVVFRPHNVYGERQNVADRYRNVIGIFMNQIMQGEPMTIFGDGTQTRAFSHIDDVAPHIARSVHEPAACNQVFNVGADQPYTVNDLAQTVAEVFDADPAIRHLPARNEVKHAFASHDKVARLLGAKATVSLREGIARMAHWAQKVGARESSRFDNIEIRKNLPPSWKSQEEVAAGSAQPLATLMLKS